MDIDKFLDEQLGAVKERKEGIAIPEAAEEPEEALAPEKAAGIAAEKVPIEARPKEKIPSRAREDDIDLLINQANALISKGDFEGARQIYIKIKELKRELPTKFMEKEQKLGQSLLSLNESMVQGIDRALSTDFNDKFNRISKFLDETSAYIKEGRIARMEDLAKVEELYKNIKQIYMALPEGFIERKVMVQDQMLRLYKMIITNKKNLLFDDFKKKSDSIIRLMQGVAEQINRNNFEDASKLFTNATALYKELPKGFLREKTGLQSRILDIYQKLVLGRESKSTGDFERMSGQINGLFSEAYSLVKKDMLKEAVEAYSKIADVYSKLPKGYYSRRADIEVQMMELQHMIILKRDKELLEETRAKANEIEMLLESAKNYLINRDFDLAKEVYGEIVDLYNTLPEGFFEENVKLQNKIVGLYKELLVRMHEPIIAETTQEEKAKYDELVRLLVEIHTHIKKKEFGEIKNKYLLAYKIYHELPLGLVEEKKNLYREIYKIYEELKLYTSMEKLSEHVEKGENEQLAELLDRTAEEYNLLSKKYPQDIELFKHIQAKCLVYLEMLKRIKAEKTEKSGLDVKKKIEAVLRKKEELGSELPVQSDTTSGASGAKKEGPEEAKKYLNTMYGKDT